MKVSLDVAGVLRRLETAQREIAALAPAPRCELDRASVLALIEISIETIRALMVPPVPPRDS